MAQSKVKSRKQEKRLKARREGWDAIPTSDKTGRSGRYSFTKPGSNKK